MLHTRSYISSIALIGLLLQGCGGSSEDATSTPPEQVAVQTTKTEATIDALGDTVNGLTTSSSQEEVDTAFNKLKLQLSAPEADVSVRSQQSAGVLSDATDKIKDKLVDILDSDLGNKVTGAAFDVVLNSEGVTVVMLDAARNSETISQVMVDALSANWKLTEKMCPMLRTNSEFGEKFTALAEERDIIGSFFFERIDANMYNCLADAMLLSNNEASHHDSVSHSTNGYMALLMDRYATKYFIAPTGSTADQRDDKFVSLLLDTGDIAEYDATSKTFTGHGDGNELINEKFFYSIFKTPTSTDAFVSAMDQIDEETRTMLMDNIFLGTQADKTDTFQGYMNIIAIGSAMYDGIYGVADEEGNRSGAYGFGSYSGAFLGFASLIPMDRFLSYGRAFMNAGYQYAAFHGINVWDGVYTMGKEAWDNYTAPVENANETTTRSAGLGLMGSDWYDDVLDIMLQAWSNVSLGDVIESLVDGDKSVIDELKDQANRAYATFIDGVDENNQTTLATELTNGTVHNDTVYGIHGLIELAMQEDIYYLECGNRSTDYIVTFTPNCENNSSYTIDDAKAAFTLPPFADITLSFAYNTAADGAMAYYDKNVDAEWFADLSTNELIRDYFYPSATNVYIPNSLLSIDWLSAANNFNNSEIATTDFNYSSGYFDIYVTSTNPNILIAGSEIDLAQAIGGLKQIDVTKVDMGSDSILAVDENGTNMDGLHVYKVRTISPEDTQEILSYLSDLGDSVLSTIGLDSTNAANVDTAAVVQ